MAQATDASRLGDINRMASLYKEVFSSKAGAEVLEDLSKHFHITSPAFMQSPTGHCDSHAAASRDGSKAVIFHIHRQMAKAAKAKTVTIAIP